MTENYAVYDLKRHNQKMFITYMIVRLCAGLDKAFDNVFGTKKNTDEDVIDVKILKNSPHKTFEREAIRDIFRKIDAINNKQAQIERKLDDLIFQIKKEKGNAHV